MGWNLYQARRCRARKIGVVHGIYNPFDCAILTTRFPLSSLERIMQKSVLIRALQQEIRRHDFNDESVYYKRVVWLMMQKARRYGWVVIERYSDNNKFIRIPRSRTFKTKEDANKERKSMIPEHGGELFSISLSALERRKKRLRDKRRRSRRWRSKCKLEDAPIGQPLTLSKLRFLGR